MDKFSKLKVNSDEMPKEKNKSLFKDDYIEVIKYEDFSIVKEKDFVVCIPYLIESNQFVMRHEYIPTFKYADGQEYHITVISGGIEFGESPEKALLRELEEEAGIVVNPEFKLEFMKPLFFSKGNSSKYHPCILSLSERDYHEILPPGDGSKYEKMSKSVKVGVKYINSINTSDLITEYLLIKLREFTNQK